MSLKFWIKTPSSAKVFEKGGIEPGVMPPISAWWAREAVKKRGREGEGERGGGDFGFWILDFGFSAPSPAELRAAPSPKGRGRKTGVTTVMSGRWEPPRYGS